MKNIPKIIYFLFLLNSCIFAQDDCPSSFSCGNNTFHIKYPFHIQTLNRNHNCSYPSGFDLKCNNQGVTILNLPHSGDFYVHNISYTTQEISLHDPDNCLARRLLNNFSLDSPPFTAVMYEYYMFLSCPPEIVGSRLMVTPIACMSNSSVYVIATTSRHYAWVSEFYRTCNVIKNLMIPVAWFSQYDENGFFGDLILTWNIDSSITCKDCEIRGNVAPPTGNIRTPKVLKYIAYIIFIPFVILPTLLVIILCWKFIDNRSRRGTTTRNSNTSASRYATTATTTTSRPNIPIRGLDDSIIDSYTKVVVGENGEIPGTSDMICPICIGDYIPGEVLKCIPECQHYFHADCIDEWLRMKGICPVCRNALASVNS